MPNGISITRTCRAESRERIHPRAAHPRLAGGLLASAALTAGLLASAVLTAGRARAAEPPDARDKTLPCRPTIACTADFVPPGTVDLETGALFRRLGPSSAAVTRQWTLPFLAKLTLEQWLQLQVGSNGLTAATGLVPQDYVDDVVVGV